ncbi:MAG: CapA family protein [Alistipes sp.]
MIKIIVAGDFCPHRRVVDLIENGQYETIFSEVKMLTENADFSIVNFECPVASEQDISIKKCGPALRCDERSVKVLKAAGFNLVTLANNHFRDYGQIGIKNTLDTCRKYGLGVVGGGVNIVEATKIYYKNIANQKFAFVNVCESEFSIATATQGGSAPLNPIANYYKIKEAKENADFVIIIVHGGHEGYNLPSPRMQNTYRFFVDCGATVVINHHQHCYSGYEIYNGAPIFYGLGNFCFDDTLRNNIWNEGYMVELNFTNGCVNFMLHPYVQCNDKPVITMFDLIKTADFKIQIASLNKIIADKIKLEEAFDDFIETRKGLLAFFEPYSNKYAMVLRHWHLLPSYLNHRKKLILGNLIRCESHRDIINSLLNIK